MKRLFLLVLAAAAAYAQTAVFPGAVVTDNQLRVAVNQFTTPTLSNGINSTDLTLTVSNATGIVIGSIVTIDNEHMPVCNVVGNVLSLGKATCTNADGRGFDGTSAASHASGAVVYLNIDAWHHNATAAELKAIETALGAGLANVALPNPVPVNKGGTGVQTGTGVPIASGTTAFNFATAGGDGQYLRAKFNQAARAYEFASLPTINATDYAWSQTPGGTISIGSNTVTLTPCPDGLNGADAAHRVYLNAGSGSPTAEGVTITGGSCTSGAGSGTITFVATVARTGSWTVASNAGGIAEAWQAACATGGAQITVQSSSTISLYAPAGAAAITAPCGKVWLNGVGADVTTLQHAVGTLVGIYVNTVDDVRISGLRFDGNYPANTSTYTIPIFGTSTHRLWIEQNQFRYVGYPQAPNYDATGYPNTHSILISGSYDCTVTGNKFNSNFGVDVQITSQNGCLIRDNVMGTTDINQVRTNVNWWDTWGTAPGGFYLTGSLIEFRGNRIYGGTRLADTFGKGGPVRATGCSFCTFDQNIISGQNAGFGTVGVTNGSANITGVNSHFSTLGIGTNADVNAFVQVEGDGTAYKFSGITNGTTAAVAPNMARGTASGLRYWMTYSGDLLGCSPCSFTSITNNHLFYSGDEGLSLGGQGAGTFQYNTVANNQIYYSRVCAIVVGGASQHNAYANNVTLDNHQGGSMLTGESSRGSICLSPNGDPQTDDSYTNNKSWDDQGGAPTELYQFDVDTAQLANLTNIRAAGNTYNAAHQSLTDLTAVQWIGSFTGASYGNPPIGAAVASGTTITATGSLFHVTGTTPIATMNAAAGFLSGQVCIVADGAYTTTVAGNFATALLAVVGETICYQYDPNTSKWYAGWDVAPYGTDVASATTTTLGVGSVFTITGTTSITTLNTCNAANAGRRVTLIFSGALTFTDGNNLKISGNFVTTADDSITLVCNGTNWYEIGRSVN